MKEMIRPLLAGAIFGIVVTVPYLVGEVVGRKDHQAECVKAGVAEYRPDPNGKPKFTFKECKP